MSDQIPKFNNEEEEARFWDKNDSTNYFDQFEPANVKLSPALKEQINSKRELKKPITLRMEPSQVALIKKIAAEKGLPYQALIRMWITEMVKKEVG